MGAKHLNPVHVMCQLTQLQIENLVQYVIDNLPIRLDELSDIDEPMPDSDIRLCIDFDIDAQDNVVVAEAEILNHDWDVLHTDSYVLSHYLESKVEHFNRHRKMAIAQSYDIRREERE